MSAPAVPPNAAKVSDGVYRISTDGLLPLLTASSATRLWFLDQRNSLNAVDVWSGAIYSVTTLPRDASIRAMAADERHVFALDISGGRLFTLDIESERSVVAALPVLKSGTALSVGGDGRVWIGVSSRPELYSFDPANSRFEAVEVGVQTEVVAADGIRGVAFSDGGKRFGFYDFRTQLATTLTLPARGAAHRLLPDPTGAIWVGTTAGEVFRVRDQSAVLAVSTGRTITALAADPGGSIWYLEGADRLVPVSGQGAGMALNGLGISAQFTPAGRALLADPTGGIYLIPGKSR